MTTGRRSSWDSDELYDLQDDPNEIHNLIHSAAHASIVRDLNRRLFAILRETDGLVIPLRPDVGEPRPLRSRTGSPAAGFPDSMLR